MMISISVLRNCVNLLKYLCLTWIKLLLQLMYDFFFFLSPRPSLPPSKQANKNLILKAISEAQESVTKTTNYSTGN